MKYYKIEYRELIEQTFEATIDADSTEEAKAIFEDMDLTANELVGEDEKTIIDGITEIDEDGEELDT